MMPPVMTWDTCTQNIIQSIWMAALNQALPAEEKASPRLSRNSKTLYMKCHIRGPISLPVLDWLEKRFHTQHCLSIIHIMAWRIRTTRQWFFRKTQNRNRLLMLRSRQKRIHPRRIQRMAQPKSRKLRLKPIRKKIPLRTALRIAALPNRKNPKVPLRIQKQKSRRVPSPRNRKIQQNRLQSLWRNQMQSQKRPHLSPDFWRTSYLLSPWPFVPLKQGICQWQEKLLLTRRKKKLAFWMSLLQIQTPKRQTQP